MGGIVVGKVYALAPRADSRRDGLPLDAFPAWCRDEWTRQRWGLSTLDPYSERSGAAPAGAHILDFRPFRAILRAYKLAKYEEGTKSGAISKMVLQAIPWLCAAAIVFLIACMAVNK
jgi:hypothetical protein